MGQSLINVAASLRRRVVHAFRTDQKHSPLFLHVGDCWLLLLQLLNRFHSLLIVAFNFEEFLFYCQLLCLEFPQ